MAERPNPRLSLAKYRCTCGFKWKLKNTEGGERACKMCHKPVHPYETVVKPAKLRRMFGEFQCKHCIRTWFSGNAWEGMGQKCLKCRRMCLPVSLRPLEYRYHRPDEPRAPHPQESCEMCQRLGRNCQNESEIENEDDDDTTTYSEDSSASSAPDLQEVDNDVTPVGSDDELEGLVDELGKFKLN